MSGLWAFLGGLIGGGIIPAVIALRGQRQDARTEWRQRLDRAVEALVASEGRSQDIGRELLADLINSDLGSPADRELARRISRATLTGGLVDEAAPLDDNGSKEQE